MITRTRDIWIDNVKVIACILVLLGHFFQSMVKANLMNSSDIYLWFNQTIYYFHVPLFFIASGYLYQKYSSVNSFKSWKTNIIKKAVALGVPYFAFSFCTWLLKKLFSGSVNDGPASLMTTLFINPLSPYWYLYALFFVFVITPTFRKEKSAYIILIISAILNLIEQRISFNVYVLDILLKNEIWFMIGVVIAMTHYGLHRKHSLLIGIIIGVFFIIASILIYKCNIQIIGISTLLGGSACISAIIIIMELFRDGKQNKFFALFATYTMPVFLMHTIFAATMRSFLLKLGVDILWIHIILGIGISIIGPILIAVLMKKTVILEFFIYPNKVIKLVKKKKEDE